VATAADIAIANKALILSGVNAITAFEDGTTEADFINTVYEALLEAALGSARWSFAKVMEALTRNGTAPVAIWDAKYDAPDSGNEVLIAHKLLGDEVNIEYEVFEDGYYCNAASTSTVVLVYGYRVASTAFPPLFEQAYTFDLAAVCASGIAEDATKAKTYADLAQVMYARARKIYAQGQTAKKLDTGRLINARRS